MAKDLAYYTDLFCKMNRASLRGYTAPHKPILLLAIADLVEKGIICSNRFTLSNELIDAFAENWEKYIDDGSNNNTICLYEGLSIKAQTRYPFKRAVETPFYHLGAEPFWRLKRSNDFVEKSAYGISAIRTCFEYAEIDEELFCLMSDTQSREFLINSLIALLAI